MMGKKAMKENVLFSPFGLSSFLNKYLKYAFQIFWTGLSNTHTTHWSRDPKTVATFHMVRGRQVIEAF